MIYGQLQSGYTAKEGFNPSDPYSVATSPGVVEL